MNHGARHETDKMHKRKEHIRIADEVACHHAIEYVRHAVQEWIVTKHKGSMQLKAWLSGDVKRMARALQAALVEDGRDGFFAETEKWSGHVLYKDFMMRLDMYLTRMPAPRRKDSLIPPRGLGVYFYRD